MSSVSGGAVNLRGQGGMDGRRVGWVGGTCAKRATSGSQTLARCTRLLARPRAALLTADTVCTLASWVHPCSTPPDAPDRRVRQSLWAAPAVLHIPAPATPPLLAAAAAAAGQQGLVGLCRRLAGASWQRHVLAHDGSDLSPHLPLQPPAVRKHARHCRQMEAQAGGGACGGAAKWARRCGWFEAGEKAGSMRKRAASRSSSRGHTRAPETATTDPMMSSAMSQADRRPPPREEGMHMPGAPRLPCCTGGTCVVRQAESDGEGSSKWALLVQAAVLSVGL